MTEPNKSKNLTNLPAAPPRRLQTGVATLEPNALPPKPVLPGRRQESVVPPPPFPRTAVNAPESSVATPVMPPAPVNPTSAPKGSHTSRDSVTIHTFEELLADLDLLTPSSEAPVEAPPLPAVTEETTPANRPEVPAPQKSKSRAGRTQRIPLALPVLVRGRVEAHNAIREETRTVFVLSRGAIVTLAARVSSGETLSLINLSSGKEARCEIMDVQSNESGKNQVELQFSETTPDFWPVSFPADDAEDRRRQAEDRKPASTLKPPAAPALAPSTASLPSAVAPPSPKSSADPALADPSLNPPPESASRPAVASSHSSSHVIDLTTLILADEPSNTGVKPAATEQSLKNFGTLAPEEELPSAVSQVIVGSPLLDLPHEVPATNRESVAAQAWFASESRKSRTWIVLSVAATLLVAATASGVFYFRHRASNAQPGAANLNPAGVPASASAVAQPLMSGSGAVASTSAQPVNPAPGSASKTMGPSAIPNSTGAGSKTPAKSAAENAQSSPGESAPAAGARAKPKMPAGVLTTALVPTRRPTAQDQDPVAPSIGSAVPSGITNVLVSGGTLTQPAAPLPVGGQVQGPRVLSSVNPEYPPFARRNRVEGDVVIQADIDDAGKITKMKVLSGSVSLQQAALDALRQWKLAPGMLNGQPTTSQMTVTIKFRL